MYLVPEDTACPGCLGASGEVFKFFELNPYCLSQSRPRFLTTKSHDNGISALTPINRASAFVFSPLDCAVLEYVGRLLGCATVLPYCAVTGLCLL